MAYGLAALIDPNLQHGPLEVLLTVDEETGLTGAFAIKKGFFHGKYLLNVDSEEEGKITISSAGGGDSQLFFPVNFQKYKDHTGLKITVAGLQGGHSGTDIDLPRLNAIKIGADLLQQIVNDGAIVSKLTGGSAHNAIPRDFICEVTIPQEKKKDIRAKIESWKKQTLEIGRKTEPKLTITVDKTETDTGITKKQSEEVTALLSELEHGPLTYSKEITGLVQTSNNLAVVETKNKEIAIHLSSRSSKAKELEETRNKIKNLGEKMGCKVEQGKAYPGWEPKPEAPFVSLVKEKYEEVINDEVELLAIHAGLECGLFSDLDEELQIVSLGPNIHNAHSPEEFVEIPSVGVLQEVIRKTITDLKAINKK
jgi:dipeptidase D